MSILNFTPYHSSSKGNLYRISSATSSLLIEAGVPIKMIKEALNFKLHTIRAVLTSHKHFDHSKACRDIMQTGIPCYMTAQTAEELKLSGHRLKIIEPGRQFTIDEWTIVAFETIHFNPDGSRCEGAVGYLISDGREKCLFATDTHFIKPRFRGLGIIAIECNFSKETLSEDLDPMLKRRIYQSHMSLERVIRFLKSTDLSKVREIYLLHLSDSNSDELYFKTEVQKVTGKPTYIA